MVEQSDLKLSRWIKRIRRQMCMALRRPQGHHTTAPGYQATLSGGLEHNARHTLSGFLLIPLGRETRLTLGDQLARAAYLLVNVSGRALLTDLREGES